MNDQPGVVSIEEANDTSQPQPLTGEEDTEPSFTVKHVRDLVLVAKHRAATQKYVLFSASTAHGLLTFHGRLVHHQLSYPIVANADFFFLYF